MSDEPTAVVAETCTLVHEPAVKTHAPDIEQMQGKTHVQLMAGSDCPGVPFLSYDAITEPGTTAR